MGPFCLRAIIGAGLALASVALAFSEEGGRSTPRDSTHYTRPAIPADVAAPPAAPSALPTSTNLMRLFDVVVTNTDPNLKNTDSVEFGETSIAINPNNRNQIVISAFSAPSGTNPVPIWQSLDGGQTWTKQFSVPLPPGANFSGCPGTCDQTFDFGATAILYGTALSGDGNIYSGSTTNPASAASWAWWVVGGVAQKTNFNATLNNSDQPWLIRNRGTSNAAFDNVYVGYDDFGAAGVPIRVSTSINLAPPMFSTDVQVGTRGSGFYNPGHRLAPDPRNGLMYSLWQSCISNCATIGSNPKTMNYMLSRSTDQGATWTLNGSSTGIVVATADSTQPNPKFGTVNALLGGVDHAAVDPSTGDLYYVYGNRDTNGNNQLAIRRVFDNGVGGVTIGSENFVVNGTVQVALPSVAVTSHGTVGVFYYTYNGIVSGFPQFTAWLAVSTDQGASFRYAALTTFLSPAADNGVSGQRVLGDYMQMKAIDNCFYGSFVANRAAFYGSTAIDDPVFFKACVGQSASTHDISGDGFADIAWRDGTTQTVGAWFLNGLSVLQTGAYGTVASRWTIVGQRDFNGDGFSDFLFRDSMTGTPAIWLLNGLQVLQTGSFAAVDNNWIVTGTGDFNGDGKGDILWYHNPTGTVAVWLLNGFTVLQTGTAGVGPSGWAIVGTGDFDGDGMTDILWYHAASGTVAIWLMDGASVLQTGTVGVLASGWSIVGVGDFNGDGKSDILWWHTPTGTVAAWLLNGLNVTQTGAYGAVAGNWQIVQTGDFNADGKSDLLWRDTNTGTVAV
jgi:hypothetical protein